MKLRLGARGSALSLAQAGIVARALAGRAEVEIVTFRTTGDRLSGLSRDIAWKGLFTKEIDEAVRDGSVDLGVHSLKDLPSEIPEGLYLAAVPKREDPRDVLVSHPPRRFSELPPGARIGTASPRRRAQLLALRADLKIEGIRGNVDTRIRRLREGRWDALVLARAGLARLGRLEEITEVFPASVMLPAIGQGALAVLSRIGDLRVADLLQGLDDSASHQEAIAERGLLKFLEAGCRAPLAGWARVANGLLTLQAGVFSPEGTRMLREVDSGPPEEAEAIAERVSRKLLERGAADLIAQARA